MPMRFSSPHDRIAVFAEMARVLRPGGRFLFTADESDDPDRPAAVPDWAPIIERGGLSVVTREEIPNWAAQLKEMYDAWMANIDALRAGLGDEVGRRPGGRGAHRRTNVVAPHGGDVHS